MSYGGGYSTTTYGAQGGADGGGFVGGFGGGSQGASASKSTYGKDTLRPVTIKQILDAQQPHPDAEFKVDDVEITQISFVGQIRNISTQTTNITYKLDDGTGTIEVKQWIDSEAPSAMDLSDGGDLNQQSPSKRKLAENDWARVWGRLKAFNNKRHVGAHVIRPITDKNDVQYHLLEATYVHLYFTKGSLDEVKQENGNGVKAEGNSANNADDFVARKTGMHVTGLARRIWQALYESPQTDHGLHVQEIAAICGLNVADVSKEGASMLENGLIFTTVDDDTWAPLII